jgi:hypothetical protein
MFSTSPTVSVGFQDVRHVGSTVPVIVEADYRSEATLDTALGTANSGYYTAACLAQMTLNDKIYAMRTIADAAGIK